jgi:hypothetical protein
MGHYLVNVGPNAENSGGVGARGYWIRRSGNTVRRTWGAVDVDGSGGGTFYWRRTSRTPREQVDHFGSDEEAADFVARTVRDKQAPSAGYWLLPSPNKIY